MANVSANGLAGVVIGGPNGDFPGTALSGGVRVYAYDPIIGWIVRPVAAVAGETDRPGGLMGAAVAAGWLSGRAVVAGGGYQQSGEGLDLGAAYVLDLKP